MDDMDRLIKRCTDEEGRIDKQMLQARGVLSDNNLFGPDEVNPNPFDGAPLVEASGYSVTGSLSGRQYWIAVFWGGELGERVQIRGEEADWVAERLAVEEGEHFDLAHPGVSYPLRLDNALSILVALTNLSEDIDWHGDNPPGYPRFNSQVPMEH